MSYVMVDASEIGFGLVLWCQKKLISEVGEFTFLYQRISYKFPKGEKSMVVLEQSLG